MAATELTLQHFSPNKDPPSIKGYLADRHTHEGNQLTMQEREGQTKPCYERNLVKTYVR